jgi:dTDP-4-dehydrorhamnose 3,5-epimerase-like enzyme
MPNHETTPSTGVQILEIENRGDDRGCFFFVPAQAYSFLGTIKDLRGGISRAGTLRGNNFNIKSRQAFLVIHESAWTFYWDSGEGSPRNERVFEGAGTELILVEPNCARAVLNSGTKDLFLFELSDRSFDISDFGRRTLFELNCFRVPTI